MFMDGLQVCQPENETISGMSGIYIENPVYNIDEDKVKEFDTNFPTKEIISIVCTSAPLQRKSDFKGIGIADMFYCIACATKLKLI